LPGLTSSHNPPVFAFHGARISGICHCLGRAREELAWEMSCLFCGSVWNWCALWSPKAQVHSVAGGDEISPCF
jgi:hypothetical protein